MKLSWLVTLLTATLLLEGREFRCAFPSASPYCSSEYKHKPGPAPTLRALRDTRSSSQTSASPWLHASPQPCAFPRLCASPQPHAHTPPPRHCLQSGSQAGGTGVFFTKGARVGNCGSNATTQVTGHAAQGLACPAQC